MKKNLRFILMIFFLSCFWTAYGQNRTVTGLVVDESKLPLAGVTVVVKGTTNGTVTNIDGQYEITLSKNDNVLVFSFIGFVDQEVNVEGKSNIDIVLKTELVGLDEVVVVGYGTIRKSDLTGAVAKVGGKDLQQVATTDVVQTLQGKVAGVDVIANSGEPGAGVKIKIRGVGSWGDSNPIYVVDGFPTSDISNIDPSNIESIEVLKDASSTAIYGSRGANGVVLVTTKQGKKGKSVIETNVYAGIQYAQNTIGLTNAHEYATLRLEAFENSGKLGTIPAKDIEKLNYVINNKHVGTDWQDELLNVAPIQSYNISVRGGNENLKYNVGATLFMQEGIVDNSGMDKLFVWANNEYKLSEKITLGTNISYSTFEKNNHNSSAYSGALPVALRIDPLTSAWDDYTNDYGARVIGGVVIGNPARVVDEAKYQTKGDHKLVGNFNLTFDDIFVKGLSFKTMFAADLKFYNVKSYYPEFFAAVDQKREQSELYEQRGDQVNWAWNGYFNYNNKINDHSINAMLGAEAQEFKGSDINAKGFQVPSFEDLMYLSQAKNIDTKDIGGGGYRNTLMSYFARANYSYKSRYLFTATLRADGSSKFLDDNKWGVFPSFSAGWNMKEENFMQDVKFMDRLKLRAGWGQVGNEQAAGNFDYVTTMVNGYTYVFGGQAVDGSVAKKLANPDLKWETSEQTNIGVDMSLLNQRLDLTVDWYTRTTKDMLLSAPIPSYVGAQRPTVNAASMENKGLDVSINWRDSFDSGFNYSVGLNVSTVKNEVTKMADGAILTGGSVSKFGTTTKTVEGEELAFFYGMKTDGIINNQSELDEYLAMYPGEKAELGDVRFVDINNDGMIDDNDRTKLGSAFPDFTAGLNIGMGYKGFDLKLFFYASVGNEIVNGPAYWYQTSGVLSNYHTDRLNRWTADNPNTNEPRMTSDDPNDNDRFSDRFVEDGSYLRLRNVQLGYSFPRSVLSKIGISQLRVYCSADNLFTITDYSGWNPEIANYGGALGAGVDGATYPIPTIITGGVNITF